MATTAQTGDVYFWNATTGEITKRLHIEHDGGRMINLAASPAARRLAITRGHWPGPDVPGQIVIWDTRRDSEHSRYRVPGNLAVSITSCAISPDGRWLVACSTKGVMVVDVEGKRLQPRPIMSKQEPIDGKTVSFSPDSKWLACGAADGLAHLISLPDASIHRSVRMDERLVDCVAFSPDGRHLAAVGFDRRVKILDVATGEIREFADQSPAFLCLVRYSPDGRRVLTGGLDGRLRLWMVESGEELMSWSIPFGAWPMGEFSADGRSFVVGGSGYLSQVIHAADKQQLLRMNVAQLRSLACQKVTNIQAWGAASQ